MKILKLVIVVGIIAVCVTAWAGSTSTRGTINDEIGRYVCIAKGEVGNPIYIFDTKTGRLWRSLYRDKTHSERILVPIFYEKHVIGKDNKVSSILGLLPNKINIDDVIERPSQ